MTTNVQKAEFKAMGILNVKLKEEAEVLKKKIDILEDTSIKLIQSLVIIRNQKKVE